MSYVSKYLPEAINICILDADRHLLLFLHFDLKKQLVFC